MAVLRDSDSFRTRFLVWGIPKFFYWFSHLLFRSCRITYLGKEHEDQFLRRGHAICFAGDHQGMLYLPFHFRDRDGVVMVSASRDGDLIAHTMARFGLRSARGSSKHGGDAALQAMIDEVNAARCSAGMIVDGPLGPAGIAKRGVILLARETGLPIVPGNWWARPRLHALLLRDDDPDRRDAGGWRLVHRRLGGQGPRKLASRRRKVDIGASDQCRHRRSCGECGG